MVSCAPFPKMQSAGSSWSYFADVTADGNVYRFDRAELVAQPMLPVPSGLWPFHGFSMDETHVYFVTMNDPLKANAPVGILRLKKPAP